MNELIAIVGPSGVGKGYIKEGIISNFGESFDEPVVVTTREKRTTDGKDRRAGVRLQDFQKEVASGEIIFAHQPFGLDGDWFGFETASLDANKKPILTEVHIDNVNKFASRFGERITFIALIADSEHLRSNLNNRGTEDNITKEIRITNALTEVEKIKTLFQLNKINHLITIDSENEKLVRDIVNSIISLIIDTKLK